MSAARLGLLLFGAISAFPQDVRLPGEVTADVLGYSRRIWQSGEGLPEDFVQSFAQTPDGYLWIGTSGGLVRFDGVRFRSFSRANEPAFRDDSVYSLFVSKDGTLWAGTEGGGLIRYRAGSFRSFAAAEGLANPFVRVVHEDSRGRLWVGTDRGLFQMRGESLVRIDAKGEIPAISVHAICEDHHGNLIFGGSGILVLSGQRHNYYRSSEPFADNSVRALRQLAGGSLLIGTISGLRRVTTPLAANPFNTPRVINGVNISVLAETRAGVVWVGTYGHGLIRYDRGRAVRLTAPSSLPHNNLLALLVDREDDLWLGTQGGLERLSPSAASTLTTSDGAPQSINTIYEDPGGGILVAALNGRLFRVAGRDLVPVPLPPDVSGLPARNAFRDREGALWIGTDGHGIVRLHRGAATRFTMQDGLINDFVRAVAQAPDGSLWIGTDGGLSRFAAGAFHNFNVENGLPYASIRMLLFQRDGSLSVATDGGLAHYAQGTFQPAPALEPLRGRKIWALHEDSDRGLWIGTHGHGLFHFKNRRLTDFSKKPGLPASIHFIAEDSRGDLWMSGPTGVIAVSRRDLETATGQVAVRVYTTSEGLSTNQMNGGVQPAGALTRTGDLWFPSTRGAVRIEPSLPDPADSPPVILEQALADDHPFAITSPLRLPPGKGKLEIHYTAIRLRSPERIRFRYWLENFDPAWTDAGQRRVAYYTNVPPGDYRFHVAAYEVNDPSRSSEQVLDVRLDPPFYRSWWFLALCAAAVLGAAFAGYWVHARNVRKRFAAVLDERNRLAREMHDTLIQGCIGVSTLLEAASSAQDISPDMSRQMLDRARSEIRTTVDDARLAVWNLRGGSEGGGDLIGAVSRITGRVSHETGIPVELKVSGKPSPVGPESARNLLLSIREALNNAVRHASAGRIAVLLDFTPGKLIVEVADDGRGFDAAAETQQHYGLIGMRERMEKFGGAFQITSAPGAGTRVNLRMPLSGNGDSA